MKERAPRVVEARWFEPVINNLEASKVAELEELREPATHEEVLRELARTRDALNQLQRRLEVFTPSRSPRRGP